MPIRKTVTDKKLVANRENAKRSTGPRTKRGKSIVRFNAASLGLFAKHVVIPDLDHAEPSDFDTLVTSLVKDLQPEGTLEVFYVHEIARSMWRIRRASLAETGSALVECQMAYKPPDAQAVLNELNVRLKIVKSAEEEIGATGTLSLRNYVGAVAVMEREIPDSVSGKRLEAVTSIKGTNKEIDIAENIDSYFLSQLQLTLKSLGERIESCAQTVEEHNMKHCIGRAIAPQPILDNILRYEKTARRTLELAHRKLTELQIARRKTESSVGTQ